MKRDIPKPFLRALPLPRKYLKPGVLTLEVTEYSLRSRHMPNGYWVTLAAIVVPSVDRTILGASACSPDDEHLFDRADAAHRALGRARQVAFRVWSGAVKASPDIAPESLHVTLFGRELDAVFMTPVEHTLAKIQELAEPLFEKVAHHAALIAAVHLQKLRNQMDNRFEWSFVERKK
jgi:hypothetical protein